MGACASVARGTRDDNEAPAPEPQKEEIVNDKEAVMIVEGEQNKTNNKEVDKNVTQAGEKIQSLQSLLNENQIPKEFINNEKSTQTEAVPSEPVNVEKPASS